MAGQTGALGTGRERVADLPLWLQPKLLVLLVLALTALRLWTGASAYIVEDEGYYRLWGLYPAFGYYDHPPMVAWWIWLGQQMAGDTALGLRLVSILSAAIGSLALWRTAFLLFGPRVAGLSVLFLNATLLVGIGAVLATPDAPSVFFWGLTLWALAELTASGKASWWLAVGLFAGLGLVSKYSVLFLGAGIVLWLLMPANRRWFFSWQLWVGGLIALAVLSPVLMWNAGHDWASFYKQFGRAGRGDWTEKFIIEFIGAFLGLLNPLVAIPALAGLWQLIRRMGKGETGAGLIVLTTLPFLAYLLVHALHSRVQGNWPAPVFPAFCIMAAVFVAASTARFWRRLAAVAIVLGLGLGTAVQVHAVSPFTGKFARKDPTFQMRGWQQIHDELRQIADAQGAGYIATMGYGLNGQMAFAFRGEIPVIQLNDRIRYVMMPQPGPELFSVPGLYVTEARRDAAERLSETFGRVELVATLTRKVDGVPLEDLLVYAVEQPEGPPLEPIDPALWMSVQ